MFGQTGAPNTLGAHTCAKKGMRSKLPISKTKENILEQSMHYCIVYTKVYRVQIWENFLVFSYRISDSSSK